MKGKERVSGGYLLIVWALMAAAVCARDIAPFFQLTASGLVNDFVVDEGVLYVATDQGSIDIFDLRRRKIIDRIVLKPTLTAKGESVPTAILSVDRMNGKTLFVSRGKGNYRDIWIHEGFKLEKVKGAEEKIFAKKARFTDDEHIFMGTFGSDIILYDRNEGYELYQSHISPSAMGGMALSEDKQTAVMADESGVVRIIDVGTAEIKQEFSSENLDCGTGSFRCILKKCDDVNPAALRTKNQEPRTKNQEPRTKNFLRLFGRGRSPPIIQNIN